MFCCVLLSPVFSSSPRLCFRHLPFCSSLLRSACTYDCPASIAYTHRYFRRRVFPFHSFAVAVLSVIVVRLAGFASSEASARVYLYLMALVCAALPYIMVNQLPLTLRHAASNVVRGLFVVSPPVFLRIFFSRNSRLPCVGSVQCYFPPLFLCLRLLVRKALVLRSCLRFGRIARRSLVGFHLPVTPCVPPLRASRLVSSLLSWFFSPRPHRRSVSAVAVAGWQVLVFDCSVFSGACCSSALVVVFAVTLFCRFTRTVRFLRGYSCLPCLYVRDLGQLCRYLLKRVSRSTCHSFSCSSAAV